MTQKIVVAKPGYNAITDTNPDHLNFSSDYNTLKYNISGSKRINGSWTTNPGNSPKIFTDSVAHGLGYVPFFICYVDFVGTGKYNIVPYNYSVMTTGSELASAWIDSTYLYFDVQLRPGTSANTWNYDFTFYYKIFKNRLSI